MTQSAKQTKNLWQRLDGPAKIGLSFAALGIILTIIGIFRDPTVPITPWSLGMGSLISGLVWGVVSWGIATAAVEVERDVAEAQAETEAEAEADTEEKAAHES
ncbi:MAG: hypothetical protein R3264_18630 [Anaerolineae bacterium]|nr:hypothetical protein [Anaerolineae bacterium]